MARGLFAAAFTQALIAVIALIAGLGAPVDGPREIVGVNAFFVVLFVGSALLFQKAARVPVERSEVCCRISFSPPFHFWRCRVSRWS
jgi:hypothetical protein